MSVPRRASRRVHPRRRSPSRSGPVATFAAALGLVVVATVLVIGLGAAPAAAHASVDTAEPSAGEVLERGPDAVRIWFTEPVDVSLGGVFLYDAAGERVSVGDLRQPRPELLVLPIRGDLDDGPYIVTWRAVSLDTHAIQGTWTFRVGEGDASDAVVADLADRLLAGQDTDRVVAITWGAARWAVFAGLALFVGATAFAAAIWPAARRSRAARRVAAGGWAVLVVATVVGLLVFGAYSGGGDLADALDPDVLGETLDSRFGRVWIVRLALLALAAPLASRLFRPRRSRGRPARWWGPAAVVVGAALVSTPGLAGHASTGDHRVVAIVADAVHVAAMAVWLGGLVVLAVAVLPRSPLGELRTVVPRFSRVATASVVVLAVTGVIQTWRLVDGLGAFRDSEFGRILVLKVAAVALMLVVATFSREHLVRLLAPAREPAGGPGPVREGQPVLVRGGAVDLDPGPVPDPGGADRTRRERRGLRRSVGVEAGVGAVVLVVTALLVNAPPPADAGRIERPGVVTIEDPRVTVEIRAEPGSAGVNDLHVYTTDSAGAPVDAAAVEMTMALRSRDLAPMPVPLRELAPGHFFSPGLDVPFAGTWRARVTVRLGPVDRVDVAGSLTID